MNTNNMCGEEVFQPFLRKVLLIIDMDLNNKIVSHLLNKEIVSHLLNKESIVI